MTKHQDMARSDQQTPGESSRELLTRLHQMISKWNTLGIPDDGEVDRFSVNCGDVRVLVELASGAVEQAPKSTTEELVGNLNEAASMDTVQGHRQFFRSLIRQAASRIAMLEGENETLRLAICGGEDAPGYAMSLPIQAILDVQSENERRPRELSATISRLQEENAGLRAAVEEADQIVRHLYRDREGGLRLHADFYDRANAFIANARSILSKDSSDG